MLITIISMLLLVINWLGMQAIYSSSLSYKSVEASQQMTQQFLIAEQALKAAEQWLEQTQTLPEPVSVCTQTPCILIAQAVNFVPNQNATWWTPANKAVVNVTMNLPQFYRASYVVEQWVDVNMSDQRYYRITAQGELFTQNNIISSEELLTQRSPTILQSTWVKSMDDNKRQSWRQW